MDSSREQHRDRRRKRARSDPEPEEEVGQLEKKRALTAWPRGFPAGSLGASSVSAASVAPGAWATQAASVAKPKPPPGSRKLPMPKDHPKPQPSRTHMHPYVFEAKVEHKMSGSCDFTCNCGHIVRVPVVVEQDPVADMRTPQTPEAQPQTQFALSNVHVADEVALALLKEMYFEFLEARRRKAEMLVNADEALASESAAASS